MSRLRKPRAMPRRVSSLPLMVSGGTVGAVFPVEEREDVAHAAFQGASQSGEFGASGRGSPGVERFDELGHHAAAFVFVLLRVAA